MNDKTTHFGYKTVEEDKKSSLVADVFHSVAGKYDIMNGIGLANRTLRTHGNE